MQTIGDIMTHPVTTVRMNDTVKTIQKILQETGFHHLVVKENKKPVGVINVRDVLRHLSPFIGNDLMERPQDINTLRKCAHQIMHRDLVTVHEHILLTEAGELLLSHRFRGTDQQAGGDRSRCDRTPAELQPLLRRAVFTPSADGLCRMARASRRGT